MEVAVTNYGQPIITPETMEHVGRNISHKASIEFTDTMRPSFTIDQDNYEIGSLRVPFETIRTWFKNQVVRSVSSENDYVSEGYYFLYETIEDIDDAETRSRRVDAIAQGIISKCESFTLRLEDFFAEYIDSILEQADLPACSIVLARDALYDIVNEKNEVEGNSFLVPVYMRAELSYLIGKNGGSVTRFLSRLVGDSNEEEPHMALWSRFAEVTYYDTCHVDDWNVVSKSVTYKSIDPPSSLE